MSTTVTTPPQVDQRVELTFARRERGAMNTCWLEGEYPEGHRPDALFAALEAEGWTIEDSLIPPVRKTTYLPDVPAGQSHFRDEGYRVQDWSATKRGTALFGGWTAEEKRDNMRCARAVLRRFGFTRVPTWTKTLADML